MGTIAQWLRAAAGDPPRRGTALRYAGAIAVVQVGWILRLQLPDSLGLASFLVLVLLEVAIPAWAERGSTTTYHPHHIAERYGLFTVIVLGEAVTAAALAVKAGIDQTDNPTPLIVLAVMGVIILFALWWLYFDQESDGTGLEKQSRALFWGYGHYFVFAGAAAVGAGLTTGVAYDLQHLAAESGAAQGAAHMSSMVAAGAVTVPIAVYLLAMTVLRLGALQHPKVRIIVPVAAAAVLASTFSSAPIHLSAAILTATVAVEILLTRSRSH